jgi:hypothetical protein
MRAGQALIESCMAIALISLVLFGILQLSQLLAAREVAEYAAGRGARARTVGFNSWMVEKTVRAGAIPLAGKLVEPAFVNENLWLRGVVANSTPGDVWSTLLAAQPDSEQARIERARIPEYLASPNPGYARAMLDYDRWDDVSHAVIDRGLVPGGDPDTDFMTEVKATARVPLWVPMHRSFYADDEVRLSGSTVMEDHYMLYLEDMGW